MRIWPFRREARITLTEALDLYLHHAVDLRPRSQQNLRVRVSLWQRMGMTLRASRINADAYDEFRRRALANGYEPQTVETCVSAVNTLVRHLGPRSIVPHGREILSTVPTKGRCLKLNQEPGEMPSLAALSAAYEAAEYAEFPHEHVSPPIWWRLFFALSYNTALRIGDLLSVSWEQVDWDERLICVTAAKTGKHHRLPINDTLLRHLRQEGLTDSGPLLPLRIVRQDWVRSELYRLCAVADVRRIKPHGIRRRSATEYELCKPGSGSLILGHSLQSVTLQHYISSTLILQDAASKLPQPDAFTRQGDA